MESEFSEHEVDSQVEIHVLSDSQQQGATCKTTENRSKTDNSQLTTWQCAQIVIINLLETLCIIN